MTPLATRKATLEARQADLLARTRGIKQELDSHNDTDWAELATQRESDEVLEGMGNEAQTELRGIKAALARVAAGDYGSCQKCGQPISEARLDILPYTPFCQECAS